MRGKCKPLYQQKAIATRVINSSDTSSSSLSFCHFTGDSAKIQSALGSVSECPEQGMEALLLSLLYLLLINECVCMTERKNPQKYGLIMKEESTALRPNALGERIHQVLPSSATRTKGCHTLNNSLISAMPVEAFPVCSSGWGSHPSCLSHSIGLTLPLPDFVSAAFSRFWHLTAFMVLSCIFLNSPKGKHSSQIVICSQNVNKKDKTW